ncbi:hypothetical protein M0R45_006768 [Rubus argutus]|uniref:Uncharacterized protein n=1 Tax=Rubus argutus TaxID=59490 RepID=A0AAW1YRT9_RUBAR
MAVWVAVKGLSVALRNESSLRLIGGTLGHTIRLDQGALWRREGVQSIRVSIDTRRRIRMKRTFLFSPTVSVDLALNYKKCHGIYTTCGFFLHDSKGCDKALLVAATPLPSGEVVSTPVSSVFMLGATVLPVTRQKEVSPGMVSSLPLEPAKANGKGRSVPVNPIGIPSVFKVGVGLDKGPSSLFTIKGFIVEGFAAIPKIGAAAITPNLEKDPFDKMVDEETQHSGSRLAAVLFIQPGKKDRVVDSTEKSKELALTVVPQLALANMNGRIIVSPAKQKKKGRPVGAKNKVKGDKLASVAIAERPKVRGRKLKMGAMDEGPADSSE